MSDELEYKIRELEQRRMARNVIDRREALVARLVAALEGALDVVVAAQQILAMMCRHGVIETSDNFGAATADAVMAEARAALAAAREA